MNKVFLTGRVTKDIEVRNGANSAFARFSLAVDRRGKDAGTDFINCTAFARTAEILGQYVKKGDKLTVQGRLQSGSYEKDGVKRTTLDIIVEEMELPPKRQETEPATDNFMPVPDDVDLPF